MAKLIEAEPIKKFIADGLNNPDPMKAFGHDAIVILAEIEYAPTIDAVEIPDCKKCAFNEGIAYWHQCEHCIGHATNNFLAKEEIDHDN